MEGVSSKRIAFKVAVLQDWKMYCLQACLCIFQPGNFTGWVSEGVNIYAIEIRFCFEFELLWPQPCLFALYNEEQKKAGLWCI